MSFWFTDQYDWRLLLVAAALCVAGGLERHPPDPSGPAEARTSQSSRRGGCGGGLGCGVWSVHFAGMLAYQPGLVIDYDATLTLFSLFLATAIAGVGLTVAVYFPSWVLAQGLSLALVLLECTLLPCGRCRFRGTSFLRRDLRWRLSF